MNYYEEKLEEAKKRVKHGKNREAMLEELKALLEEWSQKMSSNPELATPQTFYKIEQEIQKLCEKYESNLSATDAKTAPPTENAYQGPDFVVIGVVFGIAFLMLFTTWHWVANVRLDNSGAQVLLQEFVDQSPEFSGEVTRVELGNEFCTQVTGGNSCQVRVSFQLDGRPMTGECSYGIGGRGSRQCYIE